MKYGCRKINIVRYSIWNSNATQIFWLGSNKYGSWKNKIKCHINQQQSKVVILQNGLQECH